MNVAFVGSHGTGKTTALQEVARLRPNWDTLSEATRYLVPNLGFHNPYEIVDVCGIAFYEAMVVSHWCVLDPAYNTRAEKPADVVLIDRCPLDNLAYFQVHKIPCEERFLPVLTRLALHYLAFIDHVIYFPNGVFPLLPDPMQKIETQAVVDNQIRDLLAQHCPSYYTVKSESINDRAQEILLYIDSNQSLSNNLYH